MIAVGRGVARLAVLLLGLALAAAGCSERPEPSGPPNVLLIFVDDLNTRLSSYGDPIARTPHIDRLAAMGVRFDRAYVQFPLCNPSRASILSGRYPETTQVMSNGVDPRAALGDVDFLPEHFMRHGYHTSRIGKVSHKPGPIRYSPKTARERLASVAPRLSFAAPAAIAGRPLDADDSEVLDGQQARVAARLLALERDQPFFLAVGFHKPHLPFSAPRKYFENYPWWTMGVPREDPRHLDDVPAVAAVHDPRDVAMPLAKQQRAIAAYYACIEFVDAQIGLMLDVLDEREMWDETIVVLVSDHGFHLGEHLGLWRKGTLFEQSLRVPLLIAAPGAPRGATVTNPVETVSLYPTLSELAGLPTPAGVQGESLVPFMREPAGEHRSTAYSIVRFDSDRIGRSIRTERYRYSTWGEDGAVLYDHKRDPHEYVNLIEEPKRARTVKRLQRLLDEKARLATGG